MEENEQKQSFEKEQQISHLKAVNDKLLHKYVAEMTNPKWNEVLMGAIGIFILIIPLGIFGNSEIGIGWPVIIAFWLFWFSAVVIGVFITYPLSKSKILITPAYALRPTLLEFCRRDRVTTAILLPILMGLTIWLASELRYSITHYQILGIEFHIEKVDKIGLIVFWFIIVLGIVVTIDSVIKTYYSTPRFINRLVADIDELNCNKEVRI